jgi:ankyrin repeat protein
MMYGPNSGPENGETGLHYGAHHGYYYYCRSRLWAGDTVDFQSKAGYTALHFACEQGRDKVVSLLLSKGSDFNIKDQIGYTPMHHACKFGNIISLQLLIESRASFYDDVGDHPLDLLDDNLVHAVLELENEVVNVKFPSDLNFRDAVRFGYVSKVKEFLQRRLSGCCQQQQRQA